MNNNDEVYNDGMVIHTGQALFSTPIKELTDAYNTLHFIVPDTAEQVDAVSRITHGMLLLLEREVQLQVMMQTDVLQEYMQEKNKGQMKAANVIPLKGDK